MNTYKGSVIHGMVIANAVDVSATHDFNAPGSIGIVGCGNLIRYNFNFWVDFPCGAHIEIDRYGNVNYYEEMYECEGCGVLYCECLLKADDKGISYCEDCWQYSYPAPR